MFDDILVPWHGAEVYSSNVPNTRPGVYLFINKINDKKYVGISQNVAKRVKGHLVGRGYSPVLKKAVAKYGTMNFIIVPLLYTVDGSTTMLPEIEALLIFEHDCVIPLGYNVQTASGTVGPYGEKFGELVRTALSKPETVEKLSAASKKRWADPKIRAANIAGLLIAQNIEGVGERKAATFKASFTEERRIQMQEFSAAMWQDSEIRPKLVEAMKEISNRPEVRAAASLRARSYTPEFIAARTAKMRETMSTPEFRAKRSAQLVKMHQNPATKAKHRASLLRAFSNPESRLRIAASKRGRIFVTDGTSNKFVLPENMPEGWWKGRT